MNNRLNGEKLRVDEFYWKRGIGYSVKGRSNTSRTLLAGKGRQRRRFQVGIGDPISTWKICYGGSGTGT